MDDPREIETEASRSATPRSDSGSGSFSARKNFIAANVLLIATRARGVRHAFQQLCALSLK
jgi:hypothetical protein